MFVIGVAGQAQMGKDTLSDYLKIKLNESGGNWQRTAFASNVKKVFCDTFDANLDFVETWKVKPEIPPGFDMTVRSALQFIGDGFRKIVPSIWIDLTFRDKTTAKIISDVRYVNEFKRVKQEGGINILIGRPDKLNDDPNGSEAQIRPYVEWCMKKFPDARSVKIGPYATAVLDSSAPPNIDQFDLFIMNNGSKEDLYKTIDEVVVPYVKSYVFDISIEKESESPCLISS